MKATLFVGVLRWISERFVNAFRESDRFGLSKSLC
jgi:hypothetical protein